MSDYGHATQVYGDAGHYRAQVDGQFCVWSPAGGYLMTLALRAAGRQAAFPRPLSFACHFLSAPKLEEVQLEVSSLRKTRVAESLRVSMRQGAAAVLEMLIWTGDTLDGYRHSDARMPEVPSPDALATHVYETGQSGFQTMWQHFEHRPCGPLHWQRQTPDQPRQRDWLRLRHFDSGKDDQRDAYLEASRYALFLDSFTWPAAAHAHVGDRRFVAPTISFSVELHAQSRSDWLLSDAHAPHANNGQIAIHNRLWAPDGTLIASAGGTLMCRPRPQQA